MSRETHTVDREPGVKERRRAESSPLPPAIGEPHFTPDEIAEAWKLSRDRVRRLFANEPDVLVLDNRGSFSKRRYRTLRIPESVAARVYRRLLKR